MAKQLSKDGITDGQLATAAHVTQSVDALTGIDAYNVSISGSFITTGSNETSGSLIVTGSTDITGSLSITGFPNVSASLAGSGIAAGFPFTGSAFISGSLTVSGSILVSGSGTFTNIGPHILSSSNSPKLTSHITESDTFSFIQNVTTNGFGYRATLIDENSSGSAYITLGQHNGSFGGTGFTARYATGSNASKGEIVMSLGKNGATGDINNRFVVVSEPGPIASNGVSELSLVVGDDNLTNRRISQLTVNNGTGDYGNITVGNQDIATGFKKHVVMEFAFATSASLAGFTSSSLNGNGVPNFNLGSVPFGIKAGELLTETSFYIDRGGSLGRLQPVTASLEISKSGSIRMEGHLTASGNISGSGDIIGNTLSISSNQIDFTNLPTSDPGVVGRLYRDGGTVKVSI